jgi:hypothetical protein
MNFSRNFHDSRKYPRLYALVADLLAKSGRSIRDYETIEWSDIGTESSLARANSLATSLSPEDYDLIITGRAYELSSSKLCMWQELFEILSKIQSDEDLLGEIINGG